MKQSELIKTLSKQELKKALLFSQLLFLVIGLLLSFILFDSLLDWFDYFKVEPIQILYYGVIPGLIIVMVDILLMEVFPKRYLDDGGMNEIVFKNRTIADIFVLTLVIAISEEALFRGVIQTTIGFIPASILFALVHIRYLKKPVLFISVLLMSFYIGYLFEITGNLYVTMTVHFIVNFLLGLMIRYGN